MCFKLSVFRHFPLLSAMTAFESCSARIHFVRRTAIATLIQYAVQSAGAFWKIYFDFVVELILEIVVNESFFNPAVNLFRGQRFYLFGVCDAN